MPAIRKKMSIACGLIAPRFAGGKQDRPRDSLTRRYCLNQVIYLIPKYTDSADERFLNAAEMWYKIACLLPEDS